jgi:hypothetical protein
VEAGKFERTWATLAQLLDKWLEQIEPTRRPKTIDEYRPKIDKRMRSVLRGVRFDKLGFDTLDAWYRQWLAGGLSQHRSSSTRHPVQGAQSDRQMGWIERFPATPHAIQARRSCP